MPLAGESRSQRDIPEDTQATMLGRPGMPMGIGPMHLRDTTDRTIRRDELLDSRGSMDRPCLVIIITDIATRAITRDRSHK